MSSGIQGATAGRVRPGSQKNAARMRSEENERRGLSLVVPNKVVSEKAYDRNHYVGAGALNT